MAAQEAVDPSDPVEPSDSPHLSGPRHPAGAAGASGASSVRDCEIAVEQQHLDRVYRRLQEKIHEAEFLMRDAAQRGQVGTPGALAERDAQVFRAGIHLNRLNSEFEDFLFGRIDLLAGKDGVKGPDGAYTAVEPAEGAVRTVDGAPGHAPGSADGAPGPADGAPGPADGAEGGAGADGSGRRFEGAERPVSRSYADIAETLHIGRIGVLDADYAPLVIDWRAPAAAPFYRATPVDPGRVVRRRVIRSKGRKVLGVEDDLMRPELTAYGVDGRELPVIGDGALMAALGRARGHTMHDIVASIQAEQDLVIRAPAASITHVEGGPGTGKTAVALHRAAYLLYQDRRRYAGGILIVSPTPLLVAYTEGVLPSLGEEGQVAIRAIGSLVEGVEATRYDTPAVARVKGSIRMLKLLRKAARGALDRPPATAAHHDRQPAAMRARPTRAADPSLASPAGGGRSPSGAARTWEVPQAGRGVSAVQPGQDRGQLGTAERSPCRNGAPTRLRVVAFGRRLELDVEELTHIRRTALTGTAPVNLLRPRARRLLLDALWAKSGAGARHDDPELAAELRASFDEDITTEDDFIAFLDAWWPELTPAAVLAAMADEKRLGRWSRRILNQGEVRRLARSLARDGYTVHDVALLDELQAILGTPARPPAPRDADPLDQLTGLDELMPTGWGAESRRERAERLAQERTEYAHVIVDEAQDVTPMQWRMIGRRGRHATWTVVGDPAQSSWSDPDEAAAARDEALGSRPRRRFTLTVNYRNPAEIAELATKVLALAMPGATAPSAVRATGVRPRFAVTGSESAVHRTGGDLATVVRDEAVRLLGQVDGTVGVVTAMHRREEAAGWLAGLGDRVVALGSLEAKGLEYDATVVVSPAEIADEGPAEGADRRSSAEGGGGTGAGLRGLYVALTRATQRLTVVATDRDLPDGDGVPDLLRD